LNVGARHLFVISRSYLDDGFDFLASSQRMS
jgi:hypothetical protein